MPISPEVSSTVLYRFTVLYCTVQTTDVLYCTLQMYCTDELMAIKNICGGGWWYEVHHQS